FFVPTQRPLEPRDVSSTHLPWRRHCAIAQRTHRASAPLTRALEAVCATSLAPSPPPPRTRNPPHRRKAAPAAAADSSARCAPSTPLRAARSTPLCWPPS